MLLDNENGEYTVTIKKSLPAKDLLFEGASVSLGKAKTIVDFVLIYFSLKRLEKASSTLFLLQKDNRQEEFN